ncbi:uncharacterized protein LOC110374696 isoform X1 [Helicoverpa armigera]|uniref:uncharacterized protein LOC110374696 isoform X1 n=1 Tax=Helicoverpa armigera TaxID=29058 RepID=UPI0030827490
MTDQENKNAQGAGGGSPVVMVEQSTASRHKPYRPTDLQEEGQTELHHKRSRAPAVPSVAEELKDSADNTDIKELKDDSVMTTEKQKHIVAKKLSLTTKRRGSSPEAISMTPLDVEVQRAEIVTVPSQPIPPSPTQESTDASLVAESEKKTAAVKDDEDSITEEIAELRTADPTQKASEWDNEKRIQRYVPEYQDTEETVPLQRKLANEIIIKIDNETENRKEASVFGDNAETVPLQRKAGSGALHETITSSRELKKKEISWNADTYIDKVHLQNLNARSTSWMLERKASVGPCYRKTLPFGEPSGIMICLPKKSVKTDTEIINPLKSGISLTISRKCLEGSTKSSTDNKAKIVPLGLHLPRQEKKVELKIEEENYANFLENVKGKINNFRGKIKHVLHM